MLEALFALFWAHVRRVSVRIVALAALTTDVSTHWLDDLKRPADPSRGADGASLMQVQITASASVEEPASPPRGADATTIGETLFFPQIRVLLVLIDDAADGAFLARSGVLF